MLPDPLRIGVLFSQTGFFGSTEAEHLRGVILALADINAAGGIHGQPLEPIICDPASDARRLHDLAHELIVHEKVVSLFGCAASPMRKVLLPLVERHDALLWYPTQFEGFEYSPNVMYGGPCPNQHVLPLARYFAQQGYRRIALLGSDYLFPRECNRVMRSVVRQYGADIHSERYLPLGGSPRDGEAELHSIMVDPPDVIFSTVVGPSALALFHAFRQGGYSSRRTPIATICATESEVSQLEPQSLRGHLCSLPYFESLDTPENQGFVQRFKARYGERARANFMVESSYVQMQVFAAALRLARSGRTEALREAAGEVTFAGPRGRVRMDPHTHYTYYRPHIGKVDARGAFHVVAADADEIAPDPYLVTVP